MQSSRLLALLASLVTAASVSAQPYPAQPVHLIIPVAPGGPTDILARAVSPRFADMLGQQIIVDNRPGAGGNLAYVATAKAAPDGYTLAFADIAFATNPSLYKPVPYSVRDFSGVGLVAVSPMVLVVNPSQPLKNAKDLIALVRSQPGKLSYGAAPGTPTHLGPEALRESYGLDVIYVPYKGMAAALTEIMAGRVTFAIISIGGVKALVEAGKLKPLAVTGLSRAALLPSVPTFAESGVPLPDLDTGSWWGIVAPGAVPKEVLRKLNDALGKALAAPDVRERLRALSYEPASGSPDEFGEHVRKEAAKWARLIDHAGIRPD